MHNQLALYQQGTDNPNGYYWEDSSWINPPFDEYRIIELDISAFTPEGTFPAATQLVGNLKKAGINAVVVRPDALLSNEANGLYNAVRELATDKVQQFKHFVNTCHYEGIAVSVEVGYEPADATIFPRRAGSPWQAFIDDSLMWLRDFHVDALRIPDVQAFPSVEKGLKQLRNAASQLTTQTGRQYYLLVDCEASPTSVLGRYVQQFRCQVETSRFIRAGINATRSGLAKLTGPFRSRAYRRDYLYDQRFARVLRTLFGRST